jgi:hypothetical protein
MNLWPHFGAQLLELMPFDVIDLQTDAFIRWSVFGIETELYAEKWYNDDGNLEWHVKSLAHKKSVLLLTVKNPHAYPCKVLFDGTIKRCRTEAEFIGTLAVVLNCQKVKMAVSELMK